MLPNEVREASGIALSRAHDAVLWTHNDSDGGAAIFAVDTAGQLIGRVEIEGAQNRDWEDIAVARCPRGGPDGDCVYIADIGDNRASREGVGVWVTAEPDPRNDRTARATFFRLHYPDAARDAEALAVAEDGGLLLTSKGREHPVTVYRTDPLAWPGGTSAPMRLRTVQQLSRAPVDLPGQVTGASLAPDGRTLALRSYAALQFYRIDGDSLRPLLDPVVALDSLAEPQGEGVTVGRRGRVYLVSEAGPQGIAPRLTRLRCRLP